MHDFDSMNETDVRALIVRPFLELLGRLVVIKPEPAEHLCDMHRSAGAMIRS
jgi:hypothetical protein